MTTLLVSDFKAKCLAVMDRVHTSGETVLVTRRGKPLVKVIPATDTAAKQRSLGALAGEASAKGDIVHAGFEGDWEALLGVLGTAWDRGAGVTYRGTVSPHRRPGLCPSGNLS